MPQKTHLYSSRTASLFNTPASLLPFRRRSLSVPRRFSLNPAVVSVVSFSRVWSIAESMSWRLFLAVNGASRLQPASIRVEFPLEHPMRIRPKASAPALVRGGPSV
jgi:hypothetical protein